MHVCSSEQRVLHMHVVWILLLYLYNCSQTWPSICNQFVAATPYTQMYWLQPALCIVSDSAVHDLTKNMPTLQFIQLLSFCVACICACTWPWAQMHAHACMQTNVQQFLNTCTAWVLLCPCLLCRRHWLADLPGCDVVALARQQASNRTWRRAVKMSRKFARKP